MPSAIVVPATLPVHSPLSTPPSIFPLLFLPRRILLKRSLFLSLPSPFPPFSVPPISFVFSVSRSISSNSLGFCVVSRAVGASGGRSSSPCLIGPPQTRVASPKPPASMAGSVPFVPGWTYSLSWAHCWSAWSSVSELGRGWDLAVWTCFWGLGKVYYGERRVEVNLVGKRLG